MNPSKTEPSVCAILLTANRPEYARRAVESFRTQTYENKCLLIWDTSQSKPFALTLDLPENERCVEGCDGYTIGELRNQAIDWLRQIAEPKPDIIVHFDDDDLSHPNRIAEQVALLQSSHADCVGYNQMLFWREPPRKLCAKHELPDCCRNISCEAESIGEAWLYRDRNPTHATGTSLCYWRSTWERKPFEATSRGEDYRFTNGLKVAGKSSMVYDTPEECSRENDNLQSAGPRMIARIHAGNTSDAYSPEKMNRHKDHWTRVPSWDQYCREAMEKTCA